MTGSGLCTHAHTHSINAWASMPSLSTLLPPILMMHSAYRSPVCYQVLCASAEAYCVICKPWPSIDKRAHIASCVRTMAPHAA